MQNLRGLVRRPAFAASVRARVVAITPKWLAAFAASHPRLTTAAAYWFASVILSFGVFVLQLGPSLVQAIGMGAILQVLEALGILVLGSALIGPFYAPFWIVLRILDVIEPVFGLLMSIVLLFGAWKAYWFWVNLPTFWMRRDARHHDRAQGRISDKEVINKFLSPPSSQLGGIEVATGMIPLGYLRGKPIGIPWNADAGHIAVVGPTRSGKSLHLTDTLIRWPGPVVCVDPKGEQWERTAGFRERAYGPVFRIPPQGLDLAQLFQLDQDLDLRELHETLLRPWLDGNDRIFADKALPLFSAAVRYGQATADHPLSVLARWAQDSPVVALQQAAAIAPGPVQVFTDGVEPERIVQNRFALSSWGNFSTRFSPFAAHISTITTASVPHSWAEDNASIYITYPLQSQNAVGPLAAALIAGLVRQLQAKPAGKRVLFAIDEMPTVGLPNLGSYLATVGGAGITLVLYAQALPQIEDVYGHEAALSILSNCTSQLFFPPREPQTAELISRAFGSRLEVTTQTTHNSTSFGTRYHPELEAAEVMSLPEGSLIVFSRGVRHVVQDSRMSVLKWLSILPSAPNAMPSQARSSLSEPENVPKSSGNFW